MIAARMPRCAITARAIAVEPNVIPREAELCTRRWMETTSCRRHLAAPAWRKDQYYRIKPSCCATVSRSTTCRCPTIRPCAK
jgi:hypothetical protein